MSVTAGSQRIVEHHTCTTKRPGRQHGLTRGGVSTVTVTNQHPPNATSPTDPTTVHAYAPPQATIPDPKDRDSAAQMRGQ